MPTFAQNCLVDSLAAKVALKCLQPNSQNTFLPADIVSVMDDELSQGILPLLKATSQEYFVYNVDVPIVQGKSSYTFPTRAIGNALRDVVLVDSAGNEVSLNNLMREYIKVSFPFTFVPTIWTFGQYMTANEINLYNTMIQTYTSYNLRFITERRPGGLTLSSNCGQITGITGNTLTLSYVDPAWTAASTFDIVNPIPPFQPIGDDLTITGAPSGSQITLTNLPSGIAIGQWVCPAMLSCIPQIPYDMFPLLTERTIASVAEALDMSQLVATSKAKVQEFEEKALKLARPRVKGSPRVILNRDSLPHLGFGGFGGGFWR